MFYLVSSFIIVNIIISCCCAINFSFFLFFLCISLSVCSLFLLVLFLYLFDDSFRVVETNRFVGYLFYIIYIFYLFLVVVILYYRSEVVLVESSIFVSVWAAFLFYERVFFGSERMLYHLFNTKHETNFVILSLILVLFYITIDICLCWFLIFPGIWLIVHFFLFGCTLSYILI